MSGADADFDRMGADGDGVTRSEFFFDWLDRSHDGVISRAEFEAAVDSGQLAGSLVGFQEAAASSFRPATPNLAYTYPLAASRGVAGATVSAPRSLPEMSSRVGAATVHKLVGTTKNLLQGLEEALLLRAGFLAAAFHTWRCEASIHRAERRFQQHLVRSQEEWSRRLAVETEARGRRAGEAASKAIQLRIASHFFVGGGRAVKKETWRTWWSHCRLEARRRRAYQQAEMVLLKNSARGTLHMVLSGWQKEVARQWHLKEMQRQAQCGQQELDEAKRRMQEQLGSRANHGVAHIMKKFLGSSRKGALMLSWRAWRQALAVTQAAAAKARSARQVLHAILSGHQSTLLQAYFVSWRLQRAAGAMERTELEAARAMHETRLEAAQAERGRQREATHKAVEQVIRKWAFGERRGLLTWSLQEWCELVVKGRAARRLKEAVCLAMARVAEGDRRGLLHGALACWLHGAQGQGAARKTEKSEAVLRHMLERWFRGDTQAMKVVAFREWLKMIAESRMKEAQHQSVSWALRRFFEGSKKASAHGAFLSWRGQALRQCYRRAMDGAVNRQRLDMAFGNWLRITKLHKKARSTAQHLERGSWRSIGRLAMVCWRVIVVLDASRKKVQKQVEHLLQARMGTISRYMCMMMEGTGAAFCAWKELLRHLDLERLRLHEDASRTKKQHMQETALRGLSRRYSRGALHEAFGSWKVVWKLALQELSSRLAKNELVMRLSDVVSMQASPNNLRLLYMCLNEWFREAHRMLQEAFHVARLKADESRAHVGELTQQLDRLQEQLWQAYQENDRIAKTYHKELQCKDDLMIQLQDASHRARAPRGILAATPGSASPTFSEHPAAQRQSPLLRSGCDWGEAVQRMRAEGLVRTA